MFLDNITLNDEQVNLISFLYRPHSDGYIEFRCTANKSVTVLQTDNFMINGVSYTAESLFRYMEKNKSSIYNMMRFEEMSSSEDMQIRSFLYRPTNIDCMLRKVIQISLIHGQTGNKAVLDICDVAVLDLHFNVISMVDFLRTQIGFERDYVILTLSSFKQVKIEVLDRRRFNILITRNRFEMG